MRRNYKGCKWDARRVVGLLLMIAGAIVILFCVPEWVWTSIIGIVLIALGFLLWRFG